MLCTSMIFYLLSMRLTYHIDQKIKYSIINILKYSKYHDTIIIQMDMADDQIH